MKRIVLCILLCGGSVISMDQLINKITVKKLQDFIVPCMSSPRVKTVAVTVVAGACFAKKARNGYTQPLAMDERELFVLMSRPS